METLPPDNLSAAIQELVRGQKSAKMLRRLLTTQQVKDNGDLLASQPVSAEVLVGDVLRSFTNILSVLNSGEVSQFPVTYSHCVQSEESEESSKNTAPRDRRGSYKRRKDSDSSTRLTSNLTDDGYQWRKYGQKSIQSTNFPRNYFRCTYKADEGCLATKHVEMISEDPPIYRIIYHGDHTCKNLLKAPQIILDCPSPSRDSSILLSFKTNNDSNNGGGGLPLSSASCRSLPSVKHETKEEIITSHTQQSMTMYQNYPSSDSFNYYPPWLTEPNLGTDQGADDVHSISYCSFGDSDLVNLEDVISYY